MMVALINHIYIYTLLYHIISCILLWGKRCAALGLIVDNQAAFLWDQSSPQCKFKAKGKGWLLRMEVRTHTTCNIYASFHKWGYPKGPKVDGLQWTTFQHGHVVLTTTFHAISTLPLPSLPCTWALDFKVQSRQSKITSWSLSIKKLSSRCIKYHSTKVSSQWILMASCPLCSWILLKTGFKRSNLLLDIVSNGNVNDNGLALQ